MKYKLGFIFSIFIILANHSIAANDGMSFLKLAVDGRGAALGGAGVAMSTDAAAAFYNPAGLAASDKNHLILTHHTSFADISQEFAAVQFSTGAHYLAFSVNVFSIPGIEVRGDSPSVNPDGTTTALDFYASMAYARRFNENWQLGINLKYLYEKLYLNSADGWAFDLGIRRSNLIPNLDWGITVRNLGKMSRLKQKATALPLVVSSGLAYLLPLKMSPLLVTDLEYIHSSPLTARMGLELPVLSELSLRVGAQFSSEKLNWTSGIGLSFHALEIQYGFVSDSFQLGAAHRFSVGYIF